MKFSLTTNTKQRNWITLYQIKAEMSFGNVLKGELWGYIEKEENLSQVSGNARVFDNAQVSGNARVYDNAQVSGEARVYGNARVYDNAQVSGNAQVYGSARVSGSAKVSGKIKLQFWLCFAKKEKDWNVSEVENEGIILMIKDYKPAKEEEETQEMTIEDIEKLVGKKVKIVE